MPAQLRGKEVGEHEAKLQAWRLQTQEETQRHLQEREATLAGWQAKLEARSRDLDSEQKALQVWNDRASSLETPADAKTVLQQCVRVL